MGWRPPVRLGTTNTLEKTPAQPEDGSIAPLASSYFLSDNGMMSCNCLNIELLEITEQGRMGPNLKMVTLHHFKHLPVGSGAPPLTYR